MSRGGSKPLRLKLYAKTLIEFCIRLSRTGRGNYFNSSLADAAVQIIQMEKFMEKEALQAVRNGGNVGGKSGKL